MQEVTKLEAKLADQDQTIHSLQSNVQQLQSELLVNQHRSGKQLSSQNELQKQLEILQRAEQQTRVTLESVSARVRLAPEPVRGSVAGRPFLRYPSLFFSLSLSLRKFERFRSKIIQAAYSTPGTKSPQAEITDEEVLEALQVRW